MDTEPIVLDGLLEEPSVPGGLHGSTARFRLTVSPTDERTDETLLPCGITDPELAHAVIHDLVPGDTLRVTGHLHLPRTPDEPMWLAVTTLAVLETAPLLTDPAPDPTAVLERFGPYLCYLDADTPVVEVFTETGQPVGTAPDPDKIGALLDVFEERQADQRGHVSDADQHVTEPPS
ncbi:hypothetical protein ACIF6I_36300 [Streptomyces microflavus]|uniref:Uncharacterized protein n=1 Tax=Streptomyces microflavus DSM 40593 TaxID=1303692 RepID=N0CG50_STRMI|nr:hypothetical protein [Streptomyces microflavus]AGK75101.1 hypothetical protein SFUL_116 [Streptomyces microflavus DSM 40593]